MATSLKLAFATVLSVASLSSHATELKTSTINGQIRKLPMIQLKIRPANETFAFTQSMHTPTSADISNLMQPVGDQGQLGTCATFASVGMVERYTGASLSEECLLRFRGGYDGDFPEKVTNDIAKFGLTAPKSFTLASGNKVDCNYSDKMRSRDLNQDQYMELVNNAHMSKDGAGFTFMNANDTATYDSKRNLIDATMGDNGASFEYIKSQIDKGNPVVIGIAVPDSDDNSKAFLGGNGKHLIDVTPTDNCNGMPVQAGEEVSDAYCPGHAIILVGYDDVKKEFKFKNSWGTSWGYNGYGRFSYDYVKTYRWGPTTVVANQ